MNKKHSHTNYGHLLLGTITRGDGGEDPTTLRRYQSILVQLIITTLSFIKYKFLIYYLHVGSLQIIDLGPICKEKTCLGRRVTFLSKLPPGTKLFLHFHFYLQGKPFMRNTKLVWLEVTLLTVKSGHLLVIVGSTSQLGQLFLI